MLGGRAELVFEVNLSIFILFGDVMESELFCVIVIWLICVWLWVHCSKRCSKLGFFLRYCSWLLEWNSYFGWCFRDSVFIVLNLVSCWSIVLDFWNDILILVGVVLRGWFVLMFAKWYIVTWPVWFCVVHGVSFPVRISKSFLEFLGPPRAITSTTTLPSSFQFHPRNSSADVEHKR